MSTPQDPFASPPEDRDRGDGVTPPPTPPAPAWGTPPPGSTPPPPSGWGAPGGQSGWGGNQGPPPQQGTSNGVGVAALVVGILALVTSIFVLPALLGVVAIVLGVIALGKVKRSEASNKGMAIAGIITGALSILVAGVIIAIGAWFISSDAGSELADCLESAAGDPVAEAECQREFEESLTG